jgi:IS5 family transposase
VDSRLLEIARAKVVQAAKRVGIALKQTFVQEGKELRRKAGGYAHAKQFKRLRRTVKRQRTILGIVLREIGRKLTSATCESPSAPLLHLNTLLERAERIRNATTEGQEQALRPACTGSRVHRQGQSPETLRVRRQG